MPKYFIAWVLNKKLFIKQKTLEINIKDVLTKKREVLYSKQHNGKIRDCAYPPSCLGNIVICII